MFMFQLKENLTEYNEINIFLVYLRHHLKTIELQPHTLPLFFVFTSSSLNEKSNIHYDCSTPDDYLLFTQINLANI